METEVAKNIVELQNLSAIWSIGASVASIVLAVVAIVFSVYFYTQAKKSEKEVSNSLTKIESQADALNKITNKHLDRFTKHATERKTSENDPDLKAILDLAGTLTQGLTQTLQSPSSSSGEVKYLIGALYYCATTNFYAFMSLPSVSDYDEGNHFHSTTKRLLDSTKNDVDFLWGQLSSASPEAIKSSGVDNLYQEVVEHWIPRVKDSASAFSQIEKNNT